MALAMTLPSETVAIAGTHGQVHVGLVASQFQRIKYFGVEGEQELFGADGGRPIETEYWIYNGYGDAATLQAAIDALNNYIGQNGTLTETGNVSRSWPNTTFEGCEMKEGPFPPSGNVSGWWAVCILRWRQLKT